MSGLVLVFLLVAVGVVAVGAFLVGRGFRSPAQLAATARPPQPSVITAPVELIRPRTSVVLRGTLAYSGSVVIPAPTSVSGNLPAVTAATVHTGQTVTSGTLLGAVANRPVFVLPGRLPAYDDMGYGSTGPDVVELQDDLRALGFGTGTDTSGWYGTGTADAVAGFYRSRGYRPLLRSAVLPPVNGPRKRQHIERLASVPRGEIAFVPLLPDTVVRVAQLGTTIGSHGLVSLASGVLRILSSTDQNTASLAHVGQLGEALSDQKSGGFRIRLLAIRKVNGNAGDAPRARLVFSPTSTSAASNFVGENLALKLQVGAGGAARLVVPVSAIYMQADGHAHVIVIRHGKRVPIAVTPGIAYAGNEVIAAHVGRLKRGARVVIGS